MIELSTQQCRVIGVMLEKETTTPEQYPLSLNGLTNGCNQKSNREPVLSLSESDVQNVLDDLVQMKQVIIDSHTSSRVNKYYHRFCNTQFGDFQFTVQQRAIICVLLLRGPQTPGELRTRTNRLADFTDVTEVEAALEQLQNLNDKVFVKKLVREPGKRESRYVHLFSELDESTMDEAENITQTEQMPLESQKALLPRVTLLEQQVASLIEELARLTQSIENSR